MPLATSTLLTPHFRAGELGADQLEVTEAILSNLRQTADWLEVARRELGGEPVDVTSGFRTPAHNAAIGGDPHSDHPFGLAADFKRPGLSQFAVYQRLQDAAAAGRLPAFDQLIFYAADDHIHVGLGAARRGQVLYKLTEGGYVQLAGDVVAQLRGFV